MSEKDLPRFLSLIFNVFFATFVCCILNQQLTLGGHIPSVSVASKALFATVCTDSDGNTRNDNETWTSSSGSCDRRICVAKSNEPIQYELKYDCNKPGEIFDSANCQLTSDPALTFPDCCPEIHCSNGTAPVDNTPACSDLSPLMSCLIWKAATNCTSSTDSQVQQVYNITVDFCRKTCGYCS